MMTEYSKLLKDCFISWPFLSNQVASLKKGNHIFKYKIFSAFYFIIIIIYVVIIIIIVTLTTSRRKIYINKKRVNKLQKLLIFILK